ncbi:hypothetical protein KQH50_00830 [bacterium]|nr:hypothetical protein [bacterium]
MKRSLFSPFLIALLGLLLWVALIPLQHTSAQPEDDPDFVVTLALMAVADDRLDGVMDTSALADLRAEVDDYYTRKGYLQMDEDTRTALNHQKGVVLSALDDKIDFQNSVSSRAQIGLFMGMIDSFDYSRSSDPDISPDHYIMMALSSRHQPNPEAVAMLQQRLAADTESALQHNLDGHVANGVQGGSALVGGAYDFSAGQGDAGANLTVQPRPINFTNIGSSTVHVSVEYYQPPKGLSVSTPGMNVEVPGGSSVVMTGFPQGNYVFCVDWQTDMDTDGDGVKDYDRAVVRGWVSSGHPEDPAQAQVVQVSAGFSPTPSGRCGGFVGEAPSTEEALGERAMTEDDPGYVDVAPTEEEPEDTAPGDQIDDDSWDDDDDGGDGGGHGADFWYQGDDYGDDQASGNTLTSSELANQGGHAYKVICYEPGEVSETTYFHSSFDFTEGGVVLDGGDFYKRISTNVYQNDYGTKITFSGIGFTSETTYTITSSEGVDENINRTCSAQIDD